MQDEVSALLEILVHTQIQKVSGSLGTLSCGFLGTSPRPPSSVGGALINPSGDFRHSKVESLNFR